MVSFNSTVIVKTFRFLIFAELSMSGGGTLAETLGMANHFDYVTPWRACRDWVQFSRTTQRGRRALWQSTTLSAVTQR